MNTDEASTRGARGPIPCFLDEFERRLALAGATVAALLALAAGCGTTEDDRDADASAANWRIIQAYIDLDVAWHAKSDEILRADLEGEERQRRLREETGEHPDIVLAVVAAKAIVDAGGERVRDAAKFLVEHPRGLSPTAERDIEFGLTALKSLVGPDWTVVEAHQARRNDWLRRRHEIIDADIPDDEKRDRLADVGGAPANASAIAAALSILDLGSGHEQGPDAAEFLTKPAIGSSTPEAALLAARAILVHWPDYDGWADVLALIGDLLPESGGEFVAEMAATAADPVLRAIARRVAVAALIDDLNEGSVAPEERDDVRRRALAQAVGLSLGVEAEPVRMTSSDGGSVTSTLAEMEARLVHGIRHATAGGTIADETGRRLDGSEEELAAYAGKVLLLDFWATWCGPCVKALPELRDLAAAHPRDRFGILMINADAEVETLTDFMEEEPMPWAHWHVGADSELVRTWRIRFFPTYLVVDVDGTILGRGSALGQAKALIEQALDGTSAAGPEAA